MASTTSVIDESRVFSLEKAVIFAVWLVVASALCWSEIVWRDEVRALSIALQGDSFIDMFRHLHGEGHPALWYILLRAAYLVFGTPLVLKACALTIAALSAYFILYRLNLPRPLQVLALFSSFAVYEYAAMSRNYGISMLLLFAVAAAYQRLKHNGFALRLLLVLLANTNVHSVILVGGFLAYWLFDIAFAKRRFALADYPVFATNAGIAAIGIILCALTVYPPFNDAAQVDRQEGSLVLLALRAVASPGQNFIEFYPPVLLAQLAQRPALLALFTPLMSILIYGSILGLGARPAAMVAAFLALTGLSLLFTVVYAGSYRHEALWLVFMLAMYATLHDVPSGRAILSSSIIRIGRFCFVALLALQVVSALEKVHQIFVADIPLSRSRDFSMLMLSRPDLKEAIVVADPDYLVEALPYYISNRTYLLREERFGNVVKFTRKARLELGLGDVLQGARKLRNDAHVPVVILLSQRLDQVVAPVSVAEGYDWQLTITPAEISEFRNSTELLQRFGPTAGSDETFDAYVLK